MTGIRCLWSRCFWTRSLVGQLIGFMLLALVVSQTISFFVYWDERGHALRAAAKEEFLVRSASVAQLLETTPAIYHPEILRAVATTYTRFWLTAESPEEVAAWKAEAWQRLTQPLPRYGEPEPAPQGTPEQHASGENASLIAAQAQASDFGAWSVLAAQDWSLGRAARYVRLDHTFGSGLTVPLKDGTWLNAAFAKTAYGSVWTSQSTVSLAITAAVLTLIAVLVAHRVSRPMRRLAFAAEAFGRGEEVKPLPEEGPIDIRRTAEAFNRMQERLRRFVSDRTGMLAAIGHDLRTPITTLRLRAEFVADPDERDKILMTLDEMQAMTEATLAFAREEATGEPTRVVDLAALTESVCSDLADLGWDVTFAESGKVPYRCRPAAIRRALRNLIENAVRYGGCARVSLALAKDSFEIAIEDNGPGIPEEEFERVFAPFFRLEGSRSRTTGGVGLGLSIARTIVRGHGGDIELINLRGRGLRAIIRLPQVPTVR